MAEIIELGDLTKEPGYPGYEPGPEHAPWVVEPLSSFRPEDEARFWLLDFHYPRGMVPLGFIYPEDGILWSTQVAAQALPLPPSKGLAVRMAGSHIYTGQVDVTSPRELAWRGTRIAKNLPAFLETFSRQWADRVIELEVGLGTLEGVDLSTLGLTDIGAYFDDACAFFRRAWEIHFEMMYPLAATYAGFYGLCQELGLDPGEISQFLQGYDSKIMQTDRKLWALTRAARESELEPVFARTEPEELLDALRKRTDSESQAWLADFDQFLDEFGHRTEGIADVAVPSWREDPTSPLGTVRTFLRKPEEHDFESAHGAAIEERNEAIDRARSRLTLEEQVRFDEALAACTAANFAWWNEEHNYYIDLRAHLPIRRAALALGAAVGANDPTDGLFVFRDEFLRVARSEDRWSDYAALVDERRAVYEYWLAKRPTMPKMLGTIPTDMDDPIMREIFGMRHHFFETVRAGAEGDSLRGVAASSGVASGIARVLHSADELHRINPGEVLVCEATSPNWTPAFAKIAACVCDSGGTLTHASIVAREYRVPAVVGTAVATSTIRDGDLVEVDGDAGLVRIIERAASS